MILPKKPAPLLGPRIIVVFFMGILLTVLGTTVFSWISINDIKVQPVMSVVVWAGFKLPAFSGGLICLIFGYISDNLGGGILGLQALAYILVYTLCAIAEKKLALDNWPYQMAAVAIMSGLTQLVVMGGLYLADRQHLMPTGLILTVALQAFFSALLAPIFFWMLEGVIRKLELIWPVKSPNSGH